MARVSRETTRRSVAPTAHHIPKFMVGDFATNCRSRRKVKIITYLRTYAPIYYFVFAHGHYSWVAETDLKTYEVAPKTNRTIVRRRQKA